MGRGTAALLVAACIGVLAVTALPASAGDNASLTLGLNTVTPAVKSVTLSSAGTVVPYANCVYGTSSGGNLGFPNGSCFVSQPGVTVTNGAAPATILVNGANMVPSDPNPTPWTLCVATSCHGSPDPNGPQGSSLPGADQYYETLSSSPGVNSGPQFAVGSFLGLTNNAACDSIFATPTAQGCQSSSPQASQTEYPAITGPSSSSDPSTTWSTTITWTAS